MGITNRQLFFMHFILIIPFTACVIPKIMADNFGTGSWLFIVLATAIYGFEAGLIAYLGNLFKNKTLFEYGPQLVGKFITYCISILYMINFFIFFSLLIRTAAEIIKSELLTETPLWATMLLIIAISGYATAKGLTPVGRIVEIIGTIVVVAALTIQFLMFIYGDILNIRPLLNFSDPAKFITRFPDSLYLFSGFEVLTIIPFTKRNGRKSVLTSMLSIVLLGFIYIIITETTYMVLGVEDTSNYNYPLIVGIRRLDIPILQFLKRIDLLFFIAWFFSIFPSTNILLYGATEYARKIFKKPNSNVVLIIMCFIGFIFGLLPNNENSANQIVIKYCYYFSGITIFLIPISLLITAKVKHYGKKLKDI